MKHLWIVPVVAAALAGSAVGARTGADFSSTATNPGNTFSAAESFGAATPTTAVAAKATADAAAYSAVVLADSPFAYWRLGEAAGATALLDSSGNAHTGTYPATPPDREQADAIGDGDGAVRWSGTQQPATVPHATALQLNGNFTIEMWLRVENLQTADVTTRQVLRKGATDVNGWGVSYTRTGLQFIRNSFFASTNYIVPNAYTHVVFAYDGANVRIYVDSVLLATRAVTYPASSGTSDLSFVPIRVEAEPTYLDEVAIYGSVLSPIQVTRHYSAGRRLFSDPCEAFRVYADVVDRGSPPSGISSVTADLSAVLDSSVPDRGAVPLTAGSYTVGGVAYGYRSPPLRVAVQPGSYSFSVTSVDAAGTHVQTGLTTSVVAPVPAYNVAMSGFVIPVLENYLMAANGGVADPTVFRGTAASNGGSLKLVKSSGASLSWSPTLVSAAMGIGFGLRLASLPVGDVTSLASVTTSGTPLYLGYQAATRRLTLRWGSNTAAVASSAVVAGTWHWIDLGVDIGATLSTAAWQVDQVDQAPVSLAASQTVTNLLLGSTVTGDAFTANYDDLLAIRTAAAHPIGPVSIGILNPDSAGTHTGSANITRNDGTAVGTEGWERLDDLTSLTADADGFRQNTVSGTSYLEFGAQDTASVCIRGVRGLVAQHKGATGTNFSKASVMIGTTESVITQADSTGLTATPSINWRPNFVTPRGATWTTSDVNGMFFRIGYATDVDPLPYFDALGLEVAVK